MSFDHLQADWHIIPLVMDIINSEYTNSERRLSWESNWVTYVKNERRNKKISAKTLSTKTGISRSYIDYIESGAREPQVDMLAKIAVVLDVPLETLVNIQKKEQMLSAITKLSVSDVEASEEEIHAVARTVNSNQSIDTAALAKTQEAFRMARDDSKIADFLENPNLKAIVKAGATLADEDLEKVRKVMESLYPDAFSKQQ